MSLLLVIAKGQPDCVKHEKRKITRLSDEAADGLDRIEKATTLEVSSLLRAYVDAGNRFFADHGFISIPCAMVPLDEYKDFLDWKKAQGMSAKASIAAAKARHAAMKGSKSEPV